MSCSGDRAALLCALAILLAADRAMGSSLDGEVTGRVTLVNRAPAANSYNVVIMSDGFRAEEMGKFAADADRYVAALMSSAPFDDCRIRVNVHRVDVTSIDSGVDAGDFDHRTFFDTLFYGRLLLTNHALVATVASQQVPEWDLVLLIVNNDQYYGGSGHPNVAVASTGAGTDVALHEIGHSAFGLADEYDYYNYCGGDTDKDHHPAAEPSEPNVTTARTRETVKWAHLIAVATPVPTTRNPDCTRCDEQASPVPAGTVGLFEGGHYFHCDAFRGEFNCRMRISAERFCAVCGDHIARVLAPFQSRCGDGVPDLDCNEACDDGNLVDGDGCDSTCRPTGCGSGARTGDEVCDDGNLVDGDGCDSTCRPTGCGSGARTGDERCDDGNLVDGDGCDSTCRPTGCGSGVRTGDERCDDGNMLPGDACSPDCRSECRTVDECSDDDACVVRECLNGLCDFSPPAGIPGATCRVEQLRQHLPCGPGLRTELRRVILRRTARALTMLERAGRSAKPRMVARQLERAGAALAAIDAKAAKLLRRDKLSSQCRDDVQRVIDEPMAMIAGIGSS